MKLISPLLSFSASGSLANLITFLNIRGLTYAKTKQGPIGGTSAAQLEQRAKFKAACEFSHTLTPEQKAYWHSQDPGSASCSWFNNFMSAYIVDPGQFAVGMIESIQHINYSLEEDELDLLIEINEVDLSRSFIIFSGFFGLGTHLPRIFTSVIFDDSTHLLAHRHYATPYYFSRGNVQVVQCKPGVLKSVQPIVFDMLIGESFVDVTIDAVDMDMSILLYTGREVFAQNPLEHIFCTHFFINSTTVRSDVINYNTRTKEFCTVVEFE